MSNRYRSSFPEYRVNGVKRLSSYPKTAFVAQPEYFRQNFFDATLEGHFFFPLRSSRPEIFLDLPAFVKENQIQWVVIVRPEWMADFPMVFDDLRRQGTKIIGYATEPVPLPDLTPHPDQTLRLENLKRAVHLPWDALVHYDPSSLATVQSLGFSSPVVAHSLPLSFEIFHPGQKQNPVFDAVFIGRYTDYRESFLLPLKRELDVVHVAHGLQDEWARDLMAQSRTVLNIHNLEYLNFETRVAQALLCETPCLSEPLTWKPFVEGDFLKIFRTPQELLELVKEYSKKNVSIHRNEHYEQLRDFHLSHFFDHLLRLI